VAAQQRPLALPVGVRARRMAPPRLAGSARQEAVSPRAHSVQPAAGLAGPVVCRAGLERRGHRDAVHRSDHAAAHRDRGGLAQDLPSAAVAQAVRFERPAV
jgi:hypothetical protein